MIDLGITKLALIGVVALIVIGPEKLPKVARMAGTLLGRAQRYISDVKSQVSREMEMEELRQLQQKVSSAAQEAEQSIQSELDDISDSAGSSWHDSYDASHHDTHDINSYAVKVKNFRRKKLSRKTAIPAWYKSRHGLASQVISGAARVRKHRPKSSGASSFF
jgi:sec-independent protein translocase protein TatB